MKNYVLSKIDDYRARVAPHCEVCRTTPERSFSYRVRQRVVTRGVLAGALMLTWGWLAHMGRFERGGW